jgi:ABC-type sugar transport system substrate-binding protein
MTIKHRIVLSLLTENEAFQREQAISAQDAARREGFDLELVWADNNPLNQIQQLYRAVNAPDAARPTAIIAQAVATEGVEGAARIAVEKGIGWVLLSDPAPSFEALHAQHPSRLLACIYVDNEALGRLQGEIVKRLLPEGGTSSASKGPR